LTAFGSAFVAARLLGGGLPDRWGGAGVAAVSLLVSSLGLGVLALAPQALLAWAGAGLTGFGCSLVFPGLGLEVVRRSPPQARATALGAYAAFQDVAYGLSGPLAGLAAGLYGYRAVFWIGLAAALGGAAVSAWLAWRRVP
jgi:predicted MFS family arabinose efflux permease